MNRISPLAPLRRIAAISTAEILLYLRNPTILATALLLAPLMVLTVGPLLGGELEGPYFVQFLLQTLATWSVLLVVYYNLTVIFVARREDAVFQRMSTGQASAWEALIAACTPSAIVTVLQVGGGMVALMALFQVWALVNPVLIVLAVLGVVAVLAALAAWSSSWTATVEGAQYSTMPVFLGLSLTSGTLLPVDVFPEGFPNLMSFTPLYAMSDLIGLGVTGTTLTGSTLNTDFVGSWQASGQPLAVIAAWIVGGILLARTTMRFRRR